MDEEANEKDELNARSITKTLVKTIVECSAAFLITKTLSNNAPATNRLKISSIAGSIGGWMVGVKAAPYIDRAVDEFYNRREARAEAKVRY
jgi:hypothetical protein